MLDKMIAIRCYYKPTADDPHERRHAEIYKNFKDFSYPFNFPISKDAPKFKKGDLSTYYNINHKEIKTLVAKSRYAFRYNGYIDNNFNMNSYDQLEIKYGFKKPEIDYRKCLYEFFPMVVERYGGCKSQVMVRNIWIKYQDLFEDITDKIFQNKKIDFDGRNHIFNLHPAQHWSNELCELALGYNAKEAMKRLEKAGALLVMPMLDGLYCVLNDNKEIELEEFTEMNSKFKQALGLKDGTWSAPSVITKFLNGFK